MTEITRTPLQPIGKGALSKLWIGVAAVALAAGGIAYAAMPEQVRVETLKAGEGPSPTRADFVLINYKGMLPDGHVFDQGTRAPLAVAEVVPGFTKALEQMQKGGKYKVRIPAELGYGKQGSGPIPPDTDLTFDIELLDFKSRAEVEQQQRMMQQLQQLQGAGQGIPGQGSAGEVPSGAEAPAAQELPAGPPSRP